MTFPDTILALASKIRMLILDVDGVLTDGQLYYGADGEAMKAFNTQDGAAIKLLQATGVELAIISGRSSPAVEHRTRELGIQHVYQGAPDKTVALAALVNATGFTPDVMAHVGDDRPDLCIFTRVGVRFAPANAHPTIAATVDYSTRASGGHGAVREVGELIMKAQGSWDDMLAEQSMGSRR